jgi:hypothetical protein
MKLFPSKLKLSRKSLLISAFIVLAPVVSIAATQPTYNTTLSIQEEIDRFLTGTNSKNWSAHATAFFNEYQDEVEVFLAGKRKEGFETSFEDAVSSADGPGPDIMALRKEMRAREETADSIGSNQSISTEHAVREAGRLGTLIRIDSLLGETDGVPAYKAVYDQAEEQLEDTKKQLDEGFQDNITQDVMKKVLAVQGIQTKILTESRLEQLRARIDSQYTNLNLVDIGRILEETNRAQKVENRANTDFLLRSSAAALR